MKPSEMNIIGIVIAVFAIAIGLISLPFGIFGVMVGFYALFLNVKKYFKHKRMGY